MSALFTHIEALQGRAPWGTFLDAGSGVNSSLWSTGLATDRWVGVTAASGHARQIEAAVQNRLRPQDKLTLGDWTNPELLLGETFDTVLADYLLGAVEGFSPYFQPHLFRRLRSLTGGVLYVVGLDPYVVGEPGTDAGRMVQAIGRLRDACLLLAGETPYREYPMEWVLETLAASGFEATSARRFGNRYRAAWIDGQLDMAVRRIERFKDRALAEAMSRRIEALRAEGLALCRRDDGLRFGADYVIAARPV